MNVLRHLKALWIFLFPYIPEGPEIKQQKRIRKWTEHKIGSYVTKQEMKNRREKLAKHKF